MMSTVFDAVAAVGSILIFVQLYLFRRSTKSESCFRIYQTFCASPEQTDYRDRVNLALNHTNHLDTFLVHLKEGILDDKARPNAAFLRYVYHAAKRRYILPNDAASIAGPWIRQCVQLRDRLIDLNGKNDKIEERIKSFFPDPPASLKKALGITD